MNESIDWSGGGNADDSANTNDQGGKRLVNLSPQTIQIRKSANPIF